MKKTNSHTPHLLRLIVMAFVLVGNVANAYGRFFFQSDTVIQVAGNEQKKLNLEKPDGELPPLPEVLNIELLRTTHDAVELADRDGWTYAHHMDLAEWRGRMYAAWNMTVKDEDVPPSKVVYATSQNGVDWSKPADLFPREVAWPSRFYFYHTKNDRMLAFCAANVSAGNVSEAQKKVLLVREIQPDHMLGEIFTLITPSDKMPPYFEKSTDQGFVEACRDAVNNNMLLEQQDYGMLLGDRKMEWHEKTPPLKGWKFGKAFCFYQRPDHQWVGISKMGFVTTSGDGGKTWTEPVLPPTLIAGSAKVWGQRTRDGQYLLNYNPDPKRAKRFPLVVVNGEDGIHFKDMRVVHGEYPPRRYAGKYKDFGYQYVRGVAAWSSDSTFADQASTWLIYSVHKEDIWLSRIPLPLKTSADPCPMDDFQNTKPGAFVSGWNIYSPKWAPVRVVDEPGNSGNRCLELRDADPTDYARAMRLFPNANAIAAEFHIKPEQTDNRLDVEVQDEEGNPFLTLTFVPDGTIKAVSGKHEAILGNYEANKWQAVKVIVGSNKKSIQIQYSDKQISLRCGGNNHTKLERLVFRTGARRGLGDTDLLQNRKDQPDEKAAVYYIDNVSIK